MAYSKETLKMSDSNKNVFYSWIPEGEIKACVVLSHGMCEHAERYDDFASFLNKNGFALFAEDHRGHGETALLAEKEGNGKLGWLSDKNGFMRVADDIHEEILEVKRRIPGKKVFLFGHSFGSFISQAVLEFYGSEIDGCILCGTAGPRPLTVAFARIMGSLVSLFTGKKHYSRFINTLAFGSYNARIKNRKTGFDWLSRDEKSVQKYMEDRLCGFICTAGFYSDIFKGLSIIHKGKNIKKIKRDSNVLFIYGTEDPVGSYSKTVQKLFNRYRKIGMKNVEQKLYEGARHELLNEINREEVYTDVLEWLEKNTANN